MILTAIAFIIILGGVGFLVALAAGLLGWPIASYAGNLPRWALLYLLPTAGLCFAVAAAAFLFGATSVGKWALALGVGVVGGLFTAWAGHRVGSFVAKFAKL